MSTYRLRWVSMRLAMALMLLCFIAGAICGAFAGFGPLPLPRETPAGGKAAVSPKGALITAAAPDVISLATLAAVTAGPREDAVFMRRDTSAVLVTMEKTPQPEAVYPLYDDERALVEKVVMAEAGGECYEGQMAVAQCIKTACVINNIRPETAIEWYKYSPNRPEPSESVRRAVAAVFDQGEQVTEEPILYFYAPARCKSAWHESQIFVMEIGGHRFFKERT